MRSLLICALLITAACTQLWSAVGEHAGSKYMARGMITLWNPSLGGDFDYEDPGATFTTDISASDLSLDNTSTTLKYEVGINLPFVFDVTIGGFGFSEDASETIGAGEEFSFGEEDFGTGTAESEFEVTDLYAEFGFRLLNLDMAGVWVGVAIHSQNVVSQIEMGGQSEKIDEDLIFPCLTARAFVNLPKQITLEGKVHLLSIGIEDYTAEYLEIHALIAWRPLHNLGLVAGWQIVDMEIDFDEIGGSDDVKVGYDLSGPFIGVLAQF